jgi:formylglycine-generating enzyme required for sulfatase activity
MQPLRLILLTLLAADSGALTLVAAVSLVSLAATAQTSTSAMIPTFQDCSNCPEMVVIPPGKLMMGSSQEDAARDAQEAPDDVARRSVTEEQPQHEVVLGPPFALSKYPITRAEFQAFVQDTGYSPAPGCVLASLLYHVGSEASWRRPGFEQTDRDPCVCVSWQDAKAYVDWLNTKFANSTNLPRAGGQYRLPTEVEWEYAARAGTRTERWWATRSVTTMRTAMAAAVLGTGRGQPRSTAFNLIRLGSLAYLETYGN